MFRQQKDHISVEQETVEWERFVKLNYNRERVTFRQLWRAYEININETHISTQHKPIHFIVLKSVEILRKNCIFCKLLS